MWKSVTLPVDKAWRHMVRVLFTPFSFATWFVLGFSAWVAYLGQGGGSNNFRIFFDLIGGGPPPAPAPAPLPAPPGTPPTGPGSPPEPLTLSDFLPAWAIDHIGWFVAVAVGVFVISTAITVTLTWLRGRFAFIYLDNVVNRRAHVVAPWSDFRTEGNSLTWFNLILMALSFVVFVGVAGGVLWSVWPDIQQQELSDGGIIAIAVGVCVLLFYFGQVLIAMTLIEDFIIPTMYVRRLRVTAAWGVWYREVFRGHFWNLVVFYLMKFVLGLAMAVIAFVATCATCCLVAVPYLGTVILLPLFVFMRGYTVFYLQQWGAGWCFTKMEADRPLCPSCDYDLRASYGAETCTECGMDIVEFWPDEGEPPSLEELPPT